MAFTPQTSSPWLTPMILMALLLTASCPTPPPRAPVLGPWSCTRPLLLSMLVDPMSTVTHPAPQSPACGALSDEPHCSLTSALG